MYDPLLLLRVPLMLGAGILAGWLAARNELWLARGDDKARSGGLLLRVRTLQFALSLYLIFATVAFCGGGLYASQFWQYLAPARGLGNQLFSSSIQTLTAGAMAACFSALHYVHSFSEKYGLDLW
jgi:hypothetical protein